MSGAVLLAAVCGASLVAGLLLGGWALAGSEGPARPHHHRLRPLTSPDLRAARQRGVLWAAAAVAACAVWLLAGWPVGGIVAGLAVVGVPWLLRQFSAGSAEVERLEALQEWVRRTSDVLAAGGGLEQTLIRSARTAPQPISVEVHTLTARLQARWPTDRALLAFADDLGDASGDLVVAALLLGAELRGPGLARVLTELAPTLTEEVTMRRKVEADRAKPRANARWLLLITVAAAGLAALNGDYLAPYGSVVGQLALAAIAGMIVGCLMWMRRLTIPPVTPRFLVDRQADRQGAPTATDGGVAG